MRERIRKILRWLDARLLGDNETFPVFRSTDGSVVARCTPAGTMEIVVSREIETGPPVHVTEKERLRVSVFRASEAEGVFWLDIDFRTPGGERWVPVLMLPSTKLPVVRSALDEVAEFLNTPEWLREGEE